MESAVTVSEIPTRTDSPEDPPSRMPATATGGATMESTAAIITWLAASPAKKRGPGRPKKPTPTLLGGLRVPRANGRPRLPVQPPGRAGAPKKYDDTLMRALIDCIEQRKSEARGTTTMRAGRITAPRVECHRRCVGATHQRRGFPMNASDYTAN
jgi:hypothetical protein